MDKYSKRQERKVVNQNDSTVAIKVLNKVDFSRNDYELYYNEVEYLRITNIERHPNILKIIDNYEDERHLYIVTEFLEG